MAWMGRRLHWSWAETAVASRGRRVVVRVESCIVMAGEVVMGFCLAERREVGILYACLPACLRACV